jgi:hypothetical protein
MDEFGQTSSATGKLSKIATGVRGQKKGLLYDAATVATRFTHVLDVELSGPLRFELQTDIGGETTVVDVAILEDLSRVGPVFVAGAQAHLQGAKGAVRSDDGFGLMVGGGKHAECAVPTTPPMRSLRIHAVPMPCRPLPHGDCICPAVNMDLFMILRPRT